MLAPTKTSAFTLFEPTRRFAVPLYQRSYVWGQEEHWSPLWDDVQRKAEDSLAGRETPPHFLGAVVLYQVKTTVREVECREIIDGQQRLTTLQLFLAAFHARALQLGDEKLLELLDSVTKNTKGVGREEETFKVWPTKTDQDVFRTVLTVKSREELEERMPRVRRKYQRKPDPRHGFVEAFLFFHDRIEDFLQGTNTAERIDRAYALLDVVRSRLEFVVIELEAVDDPQVIFESLNARGVPLLPSDLIRNFLLHCARRAQLPMDELYVKYWKPLDEAPGEAADPFWKTRERHGRIERPRIDLFLFHYLTMKQKDEVQITQLYRSFCAWWKEHPARNPELELAEIATHAAVFSSFLRPDDTTPLGQTLQRVKLLDTTTAYPLLLCVLGPSGALCPQADRLSVVRDVESFLLRRTVCGLTAKNYNRFFLSILKRVTLAPQNAATIVREALLTSEEVSTRWPDDAEFRSAWLSRPLAEELKTARTEMILRAIETRMHGPKQEGVALTGALTVEHVMPVKWKENWDAPCAPSGSLALEGETAEELRDRMLQTIGNLTLLTQSLNSTNSNAEYSTKRSKIGEHSMLMLNRWFQSRASWDETQIVERGKSLFAHASSVWARPAAAA